MRCNVMRCNGIRYGTAANALDHTHTLCPEQGSRGMRIPGVAAQIIILNVKCSILHHMKERVFSDVLIVIPRQVERVAM